MADIAFGEARFDFGRVVGQTFGLIGRNFVLYAFLALILVGIPRFAVLYAQAFAFIHRPELSFWVGLGGSSPPTFCRARSRARRSMICRTRA